jgi:predicted AlkP superfamily phosphohydrolase/phosphomutase
MPAARYRQAWPAMPAFALPSYYDGQVRINLQGREANGVVPLPEYRAACESVAALLDECRDALGGGRVVERIDACDRHPLEIGPTQADLTIGWRNAPLGLVHPRLGRIGPVPYRRTGGHTGEWGFAQFSGPGIASGDRGVASAFDVVPTIVDLLGLAPADSIDGRSLRARLDGAAASGPGEGARATA